MALYQIYLVGDYELLKFSLGLLMVYLAKIVLDIIFLSSHERQSTIFIALCFLAAMTLIWYGIAIRPQMISFCFIALAVRRLIQSARTWELPYLFGLTVLLVNIHVYWLFIPLLWFLYRCLPRFVRSKPLGPVYAWGGLALLALAGLVSPYGAVPHSFTAPFLFMNYALVWEYATMPSALRSRITEFRGALTGGVMTWILLGHIVVLTRAWRLRRALVDVGSAAAIVSSLLLAIYSVKFAPVYAILTRLGEAFESIHQGIANSQEREGSRKEYLFENFSIVVPEIAFRDP